MPIIESPTEKAIITCAVTGSEAFNRNHPDFPVTPVQFAEAAISAAQAGAAIVHIHTRDPETGLVNTDVA